MVLDNLDPHPKTPDGPSAPGPAAAADEPTDCWNRIGVWGTIECPELKQHIHCRNCPVYEAAASRLLDRESSVDHRAEWTSHFAAPKVVSHPDDKSLIIFRVRSEWFGFPVASLIEVVERCPMHSVPHTRSPILKGLVNIRGQLVACISLARLLDLAERTFDQLGNTIFERLLLVANDGYRLAFPVSEVFGLQRHRPDQLRDSPATLARPGGRFTRRVLPWHLKRRGEKSSARLEVSVGCLDVPVLFRAIRKSIA